jgi:glycosyltransferase involved in cell wall biosynthesis
MENLPGKKIKVNFLHRKPHAVGNYSVEFIFDDIRRRLQDRIQAQVVYSPFASTGLFKRLYNCLYAAFHQGEVNHITGDINYIGIFLRRRRTIQTILDCVHLETSKGIRHLLLKLFWIRIPVSRCRFVTAISESTKREILKYVDCDPSKIIVVPVAISANFRPSQRPFNKVRPRLLQIGTAPNKNIPRLIEALRGIPCVLDIVGKHIPEYEDLLKQNQIEYQYSWGLDEDQLRQKYESADILAFTSTYEGFGMPILEAQAIGRPVITSRILSMPEVAGEAALLVDPYDVEAIRQGVLRIIAEDELREQLVIKGFANVERFNPDRIARMYYALYRQTASN